MQLPYDGYNSWFTYVHRFLSFINLEHILYTSDVREIKNQLDKVKQILQKKAEYIWYEERRELLTSSSIVLSP